MRVRAHETAITWNTAPVRRSVVPSRHRPRWPAGSLRSRGRCARGVAALAGWLRSRGGCARGVAGLPGLGAGCAVAGSGRYRRDRRVAGSLSCRESLAGWVWRVAERLPGCRAAGVLGCWPLGWRVAESLSCWVAVLPGCWPPGLPSHWSLTCRVGGLPSRCSVGAAVLPGCRGVGLLGRCPAGLPGSAGCRVVGLPGRGGTTFVNWQPGVRETAPLKDERGRRFRRSAVVRLRRGARAGGRRWREGRVSRRACRW